MSPGYHSERAPLLRSREGRESDEAEREAFSVFRLLADTVQLGRDTIPISASFALQNLVQAFSIMMAGRFGGQQALDIASYGFMFATCTGSMVAIGGATALDTLCSQSLLSARTLADPTTLGQHLQQSLAVLSVLFVCMITPLWCLADRLFLALGQEPVFAHAVGHFLVWMLPAGFLQMVAECLKKFCQVQGDSASVGWATLAAATFGSAATVLLLHFSVKGIESVPVAFCLYQIVSVLLLACIVYHRQKVQTTIRLFASVRDLFANIGPNFTLAITGIATVATEWWSFEILAIMAARLKPSELGAQSILMSADLIFTTVSLGLGVATSHKIGRLLSANRPLEARRAVWTPYLVSLVLGIAEFAAIYACRWHFGRIFTRDPEVIAATARVLPLMAAFQLLDLSNGGAGGVLRGTRRNHLSGMCNFLAYYGVGLTTAWMWCFCYEWGLQGLWAGIITGSGALLVLQSTCIMLNPWEKAAIQASGSPVVY